MDGITNVFTNVDPTYLNVYIGLMRFLAPLLALLILIRCAQPLLRFRREPEIWAWLCLEEGKKLPITHWENVIGRHKRSDVIIDFPTVSRSHAVLTRYFDGSWTVSDAESKGGVKVNGKKVDICVLQPKDTLEIGGVRMHLQPISKQQEQRLAQLRTKASGTVRSMSNALLLTVFQLMLCIGYLLGGDGEHAQSVVIGFGGIKL